jgi:hypothetical protein
MGSADQLMVDDLGPGRIPNLQDESLDEPGWSADGTVDDRPQWIEISAAPVTAFNSSF